MREYSHAFRKILAEGAEDVTSRHQIGILIAMIAQFVNNIFSDR